jgi:O-antigen ligase
MNIVRSTDVASHNRERSARNHVRAIARWLGCSEDVSCPLICLMFLTLLSGTFSLERLGVASWLPLEPRMWLTPLLLLAVWLRESKSHAEGVKGLLSSRVLRNWAILLLLFHVYFAASAAWAPDPSAAGFQGAMLVLQAILLGCAFILAYKDPVGAIGVLARLFYAAGIVFAVAGFLGVGAVNPQGRMAAFWGDPNVFVRLMVVAIACAVYLTDARASRAWLLPVPLLGAAALLSGSRGGLLAGVLATLPLVALGRRPNWRLLIRASIACCLAAVLFLGVWTLATDVDTVRKRYWELTFRRQYVSHRGEIFAAAVNRFSEDPILGGGLMSFYQTVGESRGWAYPHNIFLEAGAEGGLVGLVLLSCLLVPMARIWSDQPSREVRLMSFLATYFFFASLVSGSYFDNRYLWLFLGLALVGLHVSGIPGERQEARTGSTRADR